MDSKVDSTLNPTIRHLFIYYTVGRSLHHLLIYYNSFIPSVNHANPLIHVIIIMLVESVQNTIYLLTLAYNN